MNAAHLEINLRAAAWVRCAGRDHWEFRGPDNFYWYGSASNAYDARAKGWQRWLRSKAANADEAMTGKRWTVMRWSCRDGDALCVRFTGTEENARAKYAKLHEAMRQGSLELMDGEARRCNSIGHRDSARDGDGHERRDCILRLLRGALRLLGHLCKWKPQRLLIDLSRRVVSTGGPP